MRAPLYLIYVAIQHETIAHTSSVFSFARSRSSRAGARSSNTHHTRHARQRRELVRRRLGEHPRQFRQQRRLPDRRKPDQSHPTITSLGDVEALAFGSALRPRRLDQLSLQFRELGSKRPQVRRRRLILLRSAHLELDRGDLLHGGVRHDDDGGGRARRRCERGSRPSTTTTVSLGASRALDDARSACVDLAGCRRASVARLASRARVTNDG